MRKIVTPLLGALLSFASLTALAAPAQESRSVAGLAAPAEIRVDTWGIAHIYAGSVRDAFFLQGYNVARDRLWQIDLWRKRGLGLLSKDFGPTYVAQDRAARLFLYRGDMAREWAAYGPGAQDNTTAWVAGVNAFVVWVLVARVIAGLVAGWRSVGRVVGDDTMPDAHAQVLLR